MFAHDPFGARLAAIALGIDALERRRPGGERLVPLYAGGNLVAPAVYGDWDLAEADLDDLASALPPEPARRLAVAPLLESLRAAVDLFRGRPLDYRDKLRRLVGTEVTAIDAAVVGGLQDALDALLTAGGIVRGSLGERVAAWEGGGRIEPADLPDLVGRLMAEAQRRTQAMVGDTGEYWMALALARDVPFSARCRFAERRMELNADLHFTRAALKHLVAHEVFPGHATQLILGRDRVVAGTAPVETLLVAANSVLGCVQEGIGDQGVRLIDWVEDADDAIYGALKRLRNAAQANAGWQLMGEGRPAAVVAETLAAMAFGQPDWIAGRLRLAAHPFHGPFIASYWVGDEAVRAVWDGTEAARRPALLDYLYGRAHSPASLARFGDPGEGGA